jgi:AraC-like DNA-binding protein
MAIVISAQDCCELWQEAEQMPQYTDPADRLDITWQYPAALGCGSRREIVWHEGLHLAIDDYRLHENLNEAYTEHKHPIQYGFLLSGAYADRGELVSSGTSWFCGSGFAPGGLHQPFADQRILQVNVHLDPSICESFLAEPDGAVSPALQHMFREPEQCYYYRYGETHPGMQLAVQQILRCPFQGVTKRLYLQSKILELLALMVEQELDLRQKRSPPSDLRSLVVRERAASVLASGADEIDRLHRARAILLQRLDHPPSLLELSRQVGLNDYALKRGFRRVFGKTVFGYLHDYRLEQAQQMLASGEMKVTEVAEAIGFDSRSYFSTAFRKKYGVTPKAYQMERNRAIGWV